MSYCNIDGAVSIIVSCSTLISVLTIGRRTSCTVIQSKRKYTNLNFTNSGGYGIAYRIADNPDVPNNTFSNYSQANIFNF